MFRVDVPRLRGERVIQQEVQPFLQMRLKSRAKGQMAAIEARAQRERLIWPALGAGMETGRLLVAELTVNRDQHPFSPEVHGAAGANDQRKTLVK